MKHRFLCSSSRAERGTSQHIANYPSALRAKSKFTLQEVRNHHCCCQMLRLAQDDSSSSSRFLQQIVNQLYSLSFRWTRSKLCNASLHPPRPIRPSCRAGNVEAVVSRQQIRDHDDGNPGVALEKRFHDGRIKIFFKIDFIEVWIKAGE